MVGATLCRALAAPDKSLVGLNARRQEEVVQIVVAELRACVVHIQASDKPADHDQPPGLERALAILAPEQASGEGNETGLAPLTLSDEVRAASVPIEVPHTPARPTRTRKRSSTVARDFQILCAQLAGHLDGH